jgi:hypothetical protein
MSELGEVTRWKDTVILIEFLIRDSFGVIDLMDIQLKHRPFKSQKGKHFNICSTFHIIP